jgi:transposase
LAPNSAIHFSRALARRLAVIMHRIWVDGAEFRWTREGAAA